LVEDYKDCMSITEIKSMSRVEKLQVMELLWDELCYDKEEPESPAWHGSVLAERQDAVRSGKAKFMSVDEVKSRLSA